MKSATGGSVGDAGSRQLSRVAGKMGNQQLDGQLKKSADTRDALLAFIAQRLKTLHGVQLVERSEMLDQRQWYKEVARGQSGYHLPDTTRWHESAELYKRAANSMCNGNLGRGAQLMEQALEAERAAYKSMPIQVKQELDEKDKSASSTPQELPHVISATVCPTTGAPGELKYADRILGMSDQLEDSPPLPIMRWWKEEIEEEKEEEEVEGGA
ncbi:MAG: hypothetical protein ACI8RZ_005356 [Myxococcota bacterium]|jgi:hypothetical protein